MMFFDYLFLSSRFDDFAYHAEWLSIASNQFKGDKIQSHYSKYMNCRDTMAYKMVKFDKETGTLFGWIKSFIPITVAYQARKQLGRQLKIARQLFFKIAVEHLKFNQAEKKKTEIDKHHITPEKKNEKNIRPTIWKGHLANLDREANKVPISNTGMWLPVRKC